MTTDLEMIYIFGEGNYSEICIFAYSYQEIIPLWPVIDEGSTNPSIPFTVKTGDDSNISGHIRYTVGEFYVHSTDGTYISARCTFSGIDSDFTQENDSIEITLPQCFSDINPRCEEFFFTHYQIYHYLLRGDY